MYSHVLSEETDTLKETLKSLGIQLKPVLYKMDVRPLLKAVLDQFFGPCTGLVDVMVEHIPSPIDGAVKKVLDINYSVACFSTYVLLRLKGHTWVHKPPNLSPP